MTDVEALVRLLADGRFHSGAALAERLGVSRGAVWKRIGRLAALGLDVARVPGRGYRLAAPLDLLDRAVLLETLGADVAPRLCCVEILPVVDSTNRWLLERAADFGEGQAGACLAECQTAGRGRRGRDWVSPFGANLYLSVGWHLRDLPPDLGALSLAVGLAAVNALQDCGFSGIGLKWPNDLVWRDRKLGGVLVDLHGQPAGASRIVAGIGINMAMPGDAGKRIGQPWVDLAELGAAAGANLRSRLGGRLIGRLLQTVDRFIIDGFQPFLDAWRERDAIAGRAISLSLPDGAAEGTAAGVDRDGALRLRQGGALRRFFNGEVSVRLKSAPAVSADTAEGDR